MFDAFANKRAIEKYIEKHSKNRTIDYRINSDEHKYTYQQTNLPVPQHRIDITVIKRLATPIPILTVRRSGPNERGHKYACMFFSSSSQFYT